MTTTTGRARFKFDDDGNVIEIWLLNHVGVPVEEGFASCVDGPYLNDVSIEVIDGKPCVVFVSEDDFPDQVGGVYEINPDQWDRVRDLDELRG